MWLCLSTKRQASLIGCVAKVRAGPHGEYLNIIGWLFPVQEVAESTKAHP